jgi:hypothetical protein
MTYMILLKGSKDVDLPNFTFRDLKKDGIFLFLQRETVLVIDTM